MSAPTFSSPDWISYVPLMLLQILAARRASPSIVSVAPISETSWLASPEAVKVFSSHAPSIETEISSDGVSGRVTGGVCVRGMRGHPAPTSMSNENAMMKRFIEDLLPYFSSSNECVEISYYIFHYERISER